MNNRSKIFAAQRACVVGKRLSDRLLCPLIGNLAALARLRCVIVKKSAALLCTSVILTVTLNLLATLG